MPCDAPHMPGVVCCAYNRAQGTGVNRKMMRFISLGMLLLAFGGGAYADSLPQAQPVMLPQPPLGTLPLGLVHHDPVDDRQRVEGRYRQHHRLSLWQTVRASDTGQATEQQPQHP